MKAKEYIFDASYQPQVRAKRGTTNIMLDVIIALMPALIVGIWQFGVRVILYTVLSVASAVFFEWLYRKLMHKNNTIGDLSAADLGDLLAEGMREQLGVDLYLLGSGSIRGDSLGPIVTLQDLMEVFPYKNPVIGFRMTGKQLRQAVTYLMRDEAILAEGDHCENFQFSKGFLCEYDCVSHSILQLKMNGREVQDEDVFMAAAENFFYSTMEETMSIPLEEIQKNGDPVRVAVSAMNVLEEYLMSHDFIKLDGVPRLIIHTGEEQSV